MKTKNTVYFYFAIAAALIMLAAAIYSFIEYSWTIDSYVTQGYMKADVIEYCVNGVLLPSLKEALGMFGLLSAVLFGINSVLKAIRPHAVALKENRNDNLEDERAPEEQESGSVDSEA